MTHAVLDQVPIDLSVTHAAPDQALIVGDPIHAVLDQEPIDPSVTRAAQDRAPTVGAPIHAAQDRAPTVGAPIHAAQDRAPIVGDLIHAALDRAPTVGDPIPAAPDQGPIDPSVIRAALDQVPIVGAPTLDAPHPLAIAQAVILVAAIPARRGLLRDHDDPLPGVDVRSLAAGANQAPTALALIAPDLHAAAPPRIPALQRLSRNSRSLILTSGSSMPPSETPTPPSGSPMPQMLLAAVPIHFSMSLTLQEKGRILTSKCPRRPRLIARNPARVGPGLLLVVAAALVARTLKASAFKRCYPAQGSRRAAKLRTGFAPVASPSTANLPCSAPACRPPTNCASTAASFVNARRVAALRHSLSTVHPVKV